MLVGYAGMRSRQGASPAPMAPDRPAPKATHRVEAGGASQVPSPAPPAQPSARPVETAPDPEAVSARTQEEWLKLLAALAGEDYARQHPGVLEKLAALLVAHPGEEGWEAGVLAHLSQGLAGEAAVAFWEKAAEALPGNLAVSDKLMRTALDQPGASSSAESRAKLEALLARQALRTPKDPQVAWLRAWVAFEDRTIEDGEGFLKATLGLPWQEKAGIAEMGKLDVREALDGPQHPFTKFGEMAGVLLPGLSKMRDLSKKAVKNADDLRTRGETERARELLEAADSLGRCHVEGSRLLVSYLVGQGMQGIVIKALRDQAVASGNLLALEEAERRQVLLKADRKSFRAWNQTRDNDGLDGAGQLFRRLSPNIWDHASSEQAISNATLLMTDEDRREIERCFRGFVHELDDYRAWKAATPPTP